jgi:hypothetical protein
MKLKLDENLPLQIASSLQTLGHDIHTTGEKGSRGAKILTCGRQPSARGAL